MSTSPSSSSDAIPPSERLARLERRAEVIKSRFVRALDALDNRRHQVVEVGKHAKQMAKPAAMTALGVAALVGLGLFAVGAAFRARRKHSLSHRLSAGFTQAIQRIDVARKPSLARRLGERVVITLATFAASELAKRAAKNAADGRYPDGRIAALGLFGHPALPNGERR